MEQTKKMLCSVLLFFILFNCLLPTVAFADMGPKPRVHIIVENPPEEYYLDLLTQLDYRTITTKEPTELAQWQQQQQALEFVIPFCSNFIHWSQRDGTLCMYK